MQHLEIQIGRLFETDPPFGDSKMFRQFLIVVACVFLSSPSLIVAQDSLSDVAVVSSPVLGEPTTESLASFRKQVLAQAESAARDKDLKLGERLKARANVVLLRGATMNRRVLEQYHQLAAEQLLSDGVVQSYGAIDWSKWAAFIKEMLPIFLELLKLFTGNQNQVSWHAPNYHLAA